MKLPREIEDEIAAIKSRGISVVLEQKKRHMAIRVGVIMAGIIPLRNPHSADKRCTLNIRAQLRRAAAQSSS